MHNVTCLTVRVCFVKKCSSFVAKDKQDSSAPIPGGRLCIVITNSLTFDLCMHDVFPNDMIRESKG